MLLLVGGYSPGWLGFRDSIVIGAVFLGGARRQWSPVPLWILEQSPTLRTSSAAKALAKEFLKQVAKAESHSVASPDGNEPDKEPPDPVYGKYVNQKVLPGHEAPDEVARKVTGS